MTRPRLNRGLRSRFVAIGLMLVAGCSAWAQAGTAQSLGRAADDDVSLWRVGASLVLCLALAVAGAFALRRRAGGVQTAGLFGQNRRRLQLVETLRLGPQSGLSIVVCDGRELLVVTSERSASVVDHPAPNKPTGLKDDL
jgi:hypothetical protein